MRWMCPAALAAMVLACAAAVPPDAAAAEPIAVVIIDGQNNHNWRATTPILKQALEDSGCFRVDVSSHLKEGDKPGNVPQTVPFPPDLDRYQVVLSNYNGAPWPDAFQQALERRLLEGKLGLVLFHAANNAFASWGEFNRMIGMGWRNNKFGDRIYFDADGNATRQPAGEGPGAGETTIHPFRVTIRDPDHPITHGMPRQWMHAPDQLVHGLRGPLENVHVLATAWSDDTRRGTGQYEPMMWTVRYGKGRVFHTPMGHGVESVRCVGFLTAMLRGTQWVATGEVSLPIPDNFPTAEATSLVEAP
jgi:hypothetical protein